MKKVLIIILVCFVVLLSGFAGYGIKTYNGMVRAQENVTSQWANVENQYQRRSDLIPNLVNTVKGYAEHEKSTLDAVISARAKATQTTIDASDLNETTMKAYQTVQGELSQALGRLLVVTENYPDLKANQNFMELQAQLEGTENRISTERTRYNDMVKTYNTFVRTFPSSLVAAITGFESKPYFQADESAKSAPKVEF